LFFAIKILDKLRNRYDNEGGRKRKVLHKIGKKKFQTLKKKNNENDGYFISGVKKLL